MSKDLTANQEQLLFTLAEHTLCLPISEVQEILSAQKLRSVPFAPTWLIGLLNVRSEAWPVIDLGQLAMPNSNLSISNAQSAFIALSRQQIVLAVDTVREIIALQECNATASSTEIDRLCGPSYTNDAEEEFKQLSVEALLRQLDLRFQDEETPANSAQASAL